MSLSAPPLSHHTTRSSSHSPSKPSAPARATHSSSSSASSTPGMIHLPPGHLSKQSRNTSNSSPSNASPASAKAKNARNRKPSTAPPSNLSKQLAAAPTDAPANSSISNTHQVISPPTAAAAQDGTPSTPAKGSTGKKGGRSGGKNGRQTSPKAAPALAPNANEHSQPPPSAEGLLALFSKSAPPTGHSTLEPQASLQGGGVNPGRREHSNASQAVSSADEWEMPLPAGAKENLTWQQEEINSAGGGGSKHSSRHGSRVASNASGPSSRPGSKVNAEGRKKQQQPNSRPALHPSASDSAASAPATAGGLTWQQQAFQASAPASVHTTGTGNGHAKGPSFGALEENVSFARTITPTPGENKNRSRRHAQKDAETFGLADLSLGDEAFAPLTPNRQHNNAHQNGKGYQQSPRPPRMPQPQAMQTPTKAPAGPVEPRYAGPTFHNSPAPSSLPTPSFMLRRQQGAA